jgi:hypothetical protein
LIAKGLDSMRHTRLLLPTLLALTVGACASQQPAYYVTDAATGQPVAAAQNTAHGDRGLFGSSAPQFGATSRSAYAAAPQSEADTGGRGLFNSDLFSSHSRAPVYAYQPQQPQTYSYQPPPQQAYAQQSQYRPPQPVQQTYAPQPQPAGYYTERYRWY